MCVCVWLVVYACMHVCMCYVAGIDEACVIPVDILDRFIVIYLFGRLVWYYYLDLFDVQLDCFIFLAGNY